MENQHYKSYEQAALDILRGKQPEEQEQEEAIDQEQVDEAAVHPDALHVKPVKMGGQTKYKVHAVGKNYSDGIKVGEHLSDSELDDFSEMGGKIKHMKEEIEELDELKQDTLASYADKAEKDIKAKKDEFEAQGGQMRKKSQRALDAKISNRYKGLFKAQGKAGLPYGFKEEVEDDYDQLVEEKNAFEIELPEQLIFMDYLNAAKTFTESYDDAVVVADYYFSRKDESLVIEAFTRSDIEDRIKMHQKAGSEVTLPKYGMKDGKPHAEYTVTDKESGKKTKYIHHGNMRRVERMN